MHFVDVRERAVPLSRYADSSIPSGGLDTSIVALTTDVVRNGRPIVGYGFSSVGRFAQSGLIRERFAPRLLAAGDAELANVAGTNIDPFKAWNAMLKTEKPGGHGERCVAVGTLDMAIWDAAAKIEGVPLHRFLADSIGSAHAVADVPVYASGGYLYPSGDRERLAEEVRSFVLRGYADVKIKIGAVPIERDVERIEIAQGALSGGRLAVDAMNQYDAMRAVEAAAAFAPLGLWWFEDICNPLDFETLAAVARGYAAPISAGEALFSEDEAKLLDAHGGLRRERDILLFDPVHCYGIPGFLRIVDAMLARGWPRSAFWPHGGHLFTLHIVAALGLGGCEMNPLSFQPFGGLPDGVEPRNGRVAPPDVPGIGFETKAALRELFESLDAGR